MVPIDYCKKPDFFHVPTQSATKDGSVALHDAIVGDTFDVCLTSKSINGLSSSLPIRFW